MPDRAGGTVNHTSGKPMNEAIANASLTSHWNMSSVLHLIVLDHSEADAKLTLQELERAGFHCDSAFIQHKSDFLLTLPTFHCDLVLASHRLAGWSGLEAFSLLRQGGNEIPFILVTEPLGEETAVECLKQGVTDYVLKEHLSRLPVVVARALDEKSLRDAHEFMVNALRQSETNSLLLFAHNPLPMWVVDRANLQVLAVNEAAIRHYGYDRMEFLEMLFSEFHPADELPRLLEKFQQNPPAAQSPTHWRHRLKNGSAIDVEMSLQPMEFSGVAATLIVAQDITERKRIEEERQKFLTLVENSRDIITVAGLDDHLQYVNPAGRALLGMESAEAVKGKNPGDYVSLEDKVLLQNVVMKAIQSQGHWEGELHFRHQQTGRVFPVDFLGFRVNDPQTGEPRFMAAVSRDISERRTLEKHLQRAQKFEAIGQLAGGIAHDVNNVMGAILGWTELGEEQTAATGNPILKYFEKIHTQCDRVTELIRRLLAFARRQILEPHQLSLNQSVRDVLTLLDKVIGKDVDIKTVLQEDLCAVRADPTQIEQVLMNLCLNSRDAMPQGGTLSIETQNTELSEEDCRSLLGAAPGKYAELRVTDTGIGMTQDVHDHIFEPFFTTKELGKGTGLGLATVFGIVKQHSGYINVDTEVGKGTTFRILIPVHESDTHGDSLSTVITDQQVRGGTETILIAEDHEGIREMAHAALQSQGYRILLAVDGEEALATFSLHRNEISLVLLDIIMPRLGGPATYSAIRQINPNIAVIFATGYSNESTALVDLIKNGTAILRKPYSPRVLCRRIREVLDQAARNPKAKLPVA